MRSRATQSLPSLETVPDGEEGRPCVDPAVRVVPLPDGRVQIRTPAERITIGRQARLALDLLRHCDGTRESAGILTSLAGEGHSEDESAELLRFLATKRVLADRPSPAGEDLLVTQARFLARTARGDEANSESRLSQCAVRLLGRGGLAEAVRQALGDLGIGLVEASRDDSRALGVACSDWDDHSTLRDHNQRAVARGEPILFVCLAECSVRVGPLVVPGETACYECYFHRLRSGLAFREEFDAAVLQNGVLERAGTRSGAALHYRVGAALACAQIVNFLLGATHCCVLDCAVELDLIALEMTTSRVLKLPRCEVCGRAGHAAPPAAIRDAS